MNVERVLEQKLTMAMLRKGWSAVIHLVDISTLTFLSWLSSNLVCNGRHTSKIYTQTWLLSAIMQNARDIKVILPELIVRASYMLPAQFDAGEGI